MRKLLLVAALAFAGVAGCSKTDTAAAGDKKTEEKLVEMTVDQVDQAITAKQATAVDCNPDGARKKTGVVPGAILLTDDENYAASELPADKGAKLVFYCANPG